MNLVPMYLPFPLSLAGSRARGHPDMAEDQCVPEPDSRVPVGILFTAAPRAEQKHFLAAGLCDHQEHGGLRTWPTHRQKPQCKST